MRKVPVKLPNKRASTFMLVDERDYEWAMKNRWHISNGYARTRDGSGYIVAHQFLCPAKPPLEVDHINRNRLDNRRCNLRAVTRRNNMLNKSRIFSTYAKNKSNSSGFDGVSLDARNGKWKAKFSFHGKRYFLGSSRNILNSALAVRLAKRVFEGKVKKSYNVRDSEELGHN